MPACLDASGGRGGGERLALARMTAELFRQPDLDLGFLAGGVTMGQVLSLPLLLAGLCLVIWARRARA